MLAFLNDPEIKESHLSHLRLHRDEGNSPGEPSLRSHPFAVQAIPGIPEGVMDLLRQIFYGLPVERQMKWPELSLCAIQPGADLGDICNEFCLWQLVDPFEGVIRFANAAERSVIDRVASLYQRKCIDVAVCASAVKDAQYDLVAVLDDKKAYAWEAVVTAAWGSMARAALLGEAAKEPQPFRSKWGLAWTAQLIAETTAGRMAQGGANSWGFWCDGTGACSRAFVRQSEKVLDLLASV